MGKLLCSSKRHETSDNLEAPTSRIHIDLNEIPDDQILCPLCDLIPEILKVHTDSGHVELKCKYHGIRILTIEDYFQKMKGSTHTYFKTECSNCKKIQNNKEEMFEYCYICKEDFCPLCLTKQTEKHKMSHMTDKHFPVNQKKNKCLEHPNADMKGFCTDCQENVCDKEKFNRHKNHQIIDFSDFAEEILNSQEKIKERNKILYDIIKFNEIILNTYNTFPKNYFHIKSLINVGNSSEEENKRDPREIDLIVQSLEKAHKKQQKAIKSLNLNYGIPLDGNETKLSLRKKNLGDKGLKLISKIQFKRLKDIDVSGNNITNIEPLKNMNLPYLEYLNMSENRIKDIKPIGKLNSKIIKEIFLQNNEIENLEPLLKINMPKLERLRIENNHFNQNSDDFKNLKKNYDKKFIYIERTLENFNEKYGCKLEEKNFKNTLDLSGLREGDDLLQELYLIINPDNQIKEFYLHNNEIKDASLISRFPLKEVKKLDISLNKIANLNFITEMKCTELTQLFLNNNTINDLYPLLKINDANLYIEDNENEKGNNIKRNFPKLNVISLKENHIEVEGNLSQKLLKILKNNKVDSDLE